MDAYVTEEQQLEAIKKWFQKYGSTLSWVLIIILGIVAGLRYWFHHQEVVQEQASIQYITLLNSLEQNDETSTKNAGEILLSQFSSSPYASLAALALADIAVTTHDFSLAEQHLEWVIRQGEQADFKAIARVRLMRMLIAQNKLDVALSFFDDKNADGLLTLMEELKGDILYKQKDLKGAQEYYQKALALAPSQGSQGPLLKMKLQDLGIEVDVQAVKEAKQS